jgi:hypothetical protein
MSDARRIAGGDPDRLAGAVQKAFVADRRGSAGGTGKLLAAFMRQAGKRSDVFCLSSIFSCAGKGRP